MNRARETVRRELSGEGFVMDVALIIRGQDARFGPTNSTTFGFNTVWLDGSHSRAVVCHASCPLLGRHPRNILIAVRDAASHGVLRAFRIAASSVSMSVSVWAKEVTKRTMPGSQRSS
jgi:hypothetical protein